MVHADQIQKRVPSDLMQRVRSKFVKKHEPRDTQEIDVEIAHLVKLCACLLPVEEISRRAFERVIAELEVEKAVAVLDKKYARIDLSFLNLTNWSPVLQCETPVFAVFTPGKPDCVFAATCHAISELEQRPGCTPGVMDNVTRISTDFTGTHPSLLTNYAPLRKLALVAEKRLKEARLSGYHGFRDLSAVKACAVLSASFDGLVPDCLRELIRPATNVFEEVYLIGPAPVWKLDTPVTTSAQQWIDPIVVGRKGTLFWYLA